MKKSILLLLGASVCALASTVARADAGPDPVIQWSENATRAAFASCLIASGNGLAESRVYAIVHIAIHDAVNAIKRRSKPYAFDAEVRRRTSLDAAVAAAARDTLVSTIGELQEPPECVAAGIASVEADYQAALAAIPDGSAKARGIALGQASAAAIIALREHDGSDTLLVDTGFPQGTTPGEWRFTPDLPFAFAPEWGKVKPFVLRDGTQFRAAPPLPLGSRRYAAEFNEIKKLGGDGITTPHTRTEDQTELGLFWRESSPLAWNRLARAIAIRRGLDTWENARLFGLLNMAMADGYIGSWESKYHYRFWRPVTAIREGDADGNPDTQGDPTWTPLQLTYPMPDHDSGHSVQGGVAAEVLKQVFGTDRIRFRVCSFSLPAGQNCDDPSPVLRSFSSFSQAADENAFSRIVIGIHFRRAVEEGVKHGRKIANRAVQRFMQPVQ